MTRSEKLLRIARAMYYADNPSSNWDKDARSVTGYYLRAAGHWLAAREMERQWGEKE